MPLADMLSKNQPGSDTAPLTGGSSTGLGSFVASRMPKVSTPGANLDKSISNAQLRLLNDGQPLPEKVNHTSVLNKIFEVLNYANNKKNQAISYASGDKEAFQHDVYGSDLLEQWGANKGVGTKIGGLAFDVLTDPLNLLSFGSAGAASAAAKAGTLALKGSKGMTVAKLGAHIPFTKIGASVDIPGSGEVLKAVGGAIKNKAKSLTDFVTEKLPGTATIGRGLKETAGNIFVRGYGVDKGVVAAVKRTEDLTRMDYNDIVNNMVKVRKGWDDVGHTDDMKIIRAIEDPTQFQNLAPHEVEIFNQAKDFFDVNFLKAQEAGVIDDFTRNYIPHMFNGPKKEVEAALKEQRRKGAMLGTTPGAAKDRNILMSISDILKDPKLAARLKPETNLVKIMGIYKVSLEKSIRNHDMIDELIALGPEIIMKRSTITGGMSAANLLRRTTQEIPPGWVDSPIPQLKNYAMPPELAKHLNDVLRPFNNNGDFNKLLHSYDSILGWWKGQATVPNPGFHIRNQLGNIFNNYLGGVKDLGVYKKAITVQKADDFTMDDFYDLVRTIPPRDPVELMEAGKGGAVPIPHGTGVDPREINMQRIFNSNRFRIKFMEGPGEKFLVTHDGKREYFNSTGIKFLAKLWGVTGKGMLGGDIGDDLLKKIAPAKTLNRFNPLSEQNPVFKAANKVGISFEDNARIAHFLQKLSEGHEVVEASNSVKKYLFDYTQLSPIEKNVMKRFMPFYAFTRNNLPLQIQELVKQPKYAATLAKFQNFANQLAEDQTGVSADTNSLPKYLKDLYAFRLPFQTKGDKDVFAGVDLPIRDVNNLNPKEWITSLTPFLSVPFEQITNKNIYFNKDIESYEGETTRAPGYIQGVYKAVKAMDTTDHEPKIFNQLMEKLGMTIATLPEGGTELRVPVRSAHLLNQLVYLKNLGKIEEFGTGDARDPFAISSLATGITAVSSSKEDRDTNDKYQQLQRLEDLIRKLRDEGSPVDTISEINKANKESGRGL